VEAMLFIAGRHVPLLEHYNICSRSQVNTAISPIGTSLDCVAHQRHPSDRLGPALSPPAPKGPRLARGGLQYQGESLPSPSLGAMSRIGKRKTSGKSIAQAAQQMGRPRCASH
jgi:hypothetical protein